jgi:arginyl-tRNA synthetase
MKMNLRQQLKADFSTAIQAAFGAEFSTIDPVIQGATQTQFGDFQANFAMGLAKQLKKKPVEIAQAVLPHIPHATHFTKLEVSGPGFINIHLSNDFLNQQLSKVFTDQRLGIPFVDVPQTVVIDYGSPNVAKEMHVGHLRSTIIGDSIARMLSFVGHNVIRQNHVGDWGTQFGMLIQYLLEIHWQPSATQTMGELNQFYKKAKARFDSDPDFANQSRNQVVALQSGDPTATLIWKQLVAESEQHFQAVYERLGVLLTMDDIRGESFYNPFLPQVVTELLERGIAEHNQGAVTLFLPGFVDPDNNPLPFLIQKSDGGYLYATTDLAAARYRLQTLKADRLIYVVDARQGQHFEMLFAAIRKIGWAPESVRLEHTAFGTLLGADRKPFKTRSGETIRLVDLLDEAEQRASNTVATKEHLTEVERKHIAHCIGIGALKYADLSNEKIKDYVFDWNRMLSFDGNTAPYLQNAYVRIKSIFRKGNIQSLENHTFAIHDDIEHRLAIKILELPYVTGLVAEELVPHRLCNYLFELATNFHQFYEHCPVLIAEDASVRNSRLLLCDLTARTLQLGLSFLGISVIEQM